MVTPALLLRLWRNARYHQLLSLLLQGRPEAELGLDQLLRGPLPAAAMALLRAGEFRQWDLPLVGEWRRHVIGCQERDGSWGPANSGPLLTALCIRSLDAAGPAPAARFASARAIDLQPEQIGRFRFTGGCASPAPATCAAVRRGLDFIARMQERDGSWAGDSFATAFVLLQLGRMEAFRRSVRIADALAVRRRGFSSSGAARLAWSQVQLRCGRTLRLEAMAQASCDGFGFAQPLFANVA